MFDWKSGDDEWVEEGTAVAAVPSSRFRLRARGLLALAALALLVVGLGLVYRQATMPVTAVTNTMKQEVRAADRLLLETAVAGDNEEFTALLDIWAAWSDPQMRLQKSGRYFDRPPLGLWLDTRADLFASGWFSNSEIIFTPDLNRAELSMTMPYVTLNGAGELQSLLLQRTAVYRLRDNTWLLGEPGRAFWGDFVSEERPYLHLMIPTRDQDMAVRLADDLNGWIERICQSVNCPREFQLQLQFFYDPQSLLHLYTPIPFNTVYAGGRQTADLVLPTPTLVGRPLDEIGYQALLRGYATHLVRALLNAYAFPAPVETGDIPMNPDIDSMLAQWGLLVPSPTNYHPIITVEPPPIPLPIQDILILCYLRGGPYLFRYDMVADVWSDVPLTTEGMLGYHLTPFPEGQGVAAVTGPSENDGLFRVIWLYNGRERLLFTSLSRPSVSFITELEPGRFLLRYFRESYMDESMNIVTSHDTIDTIEIIATTCDDNTCPIKPFVEWVQSSPTGRYTLITRLNEYHDFVYALGNAAGEEIHLLRNAYDPTWLNDHTVSYLETTLADSSGEPINSKMMIASITDDDTVQTDIRLSMDKIRAALPGLQSTDQLYISHVFPYPIEQPDLLFFSISDWQVKERPNRYLLQYDWKKHEWAFIDVEHDSSYWTTHQHGRYLIFRSHNERNLHLYDLSNRRWQEYDLPDNIIFNVRFMTHYPPSWSEDDNWLSLLDDGLVRLVAPEYSYEKLLFFGLDYCAAAVFIDRAGRDETGP